MPLRIAALVSGSGSNLQSIIDSIAAGNLPAEIVQVVASRYDLPAQEKATRYNLPYTVIPRSAYAEDIEAMSQAIWQLLAPLQVDLILLCGFLSFLSPQFVQQYRWRIMNIHPSLLPAFGGRGAYGLRVHQQVLDYGAKVSGCTVMFVDTGEDTGPIILQRPVAVLEGDTPESLAARVMEQEQIAYPEAVLLFAQGRLQVEGRRVVVK